MRHGVFGGAHVLLQALNTTCDSSHVKYFMVASASTQDTAAGTPARWRLVEKTIGCQTPSEVHDVAQSSRVSLRLVTCMHDGTELGPSSGDVGG